MLANLPHDSPQSGTLSPDVQLPATSLFAILDFVAEELPRWRDRTDRQAEISETVLTSQLCAHLNSAARHSQGWDILQFRVEAPDEEMPGRKIDLVPSPCGAVISIDGRSYVDFDALLPIECKRLPTPNGHDRDEREYVINRQGSTGGLQRFKEGLHGAAHALGGMIGYLQVETVSAWHGRIAGWIQDLIHETRPGWSDQDLLQLDREDQNSKLAVLQSTHARAKDLNAISLRHFWIGMH